MKTERLFDTWYNQLQNYPKKDALAKKENGTWKTFSTENVIELGSNLSLGFLELGLGAADKIAIISFNCPEWVISDLGIQQIGAVSVPMYPNSTVEDYKYIFNDAGVKLVIVQNKELYTKVLEAAKSFETIKDIYTIDRIDGAKNWYDLVEKGKSSSKKSELEALKKAVKPSDLLTLIYTSGTTGNPKGVMLTHSNIGSNVLASMCCLPCNFESRALSFLPLCHVFERTISYVYINGGVSIYYAESMETIGDNLKEVQPTLFSTVPRLLEKVYDKIYQKGLELSGIKKALFFWALNLGLKYKMNENQGFFYDFQLKLANKIIFSKWREALGGKVICIISGSAALQPRLATVFNAANIRIMEGYGLTETSPVIAVNRFDKDNNRIGTVGPLLDGVEVKIAADGEILSRGPHIMKGYYNKPEETAKVIDADGWFATGDIGEFVEGRFLKITDRKKDVFKTSGGKYIVPQVLENKFKESVFIEQIMVVGEGQKFASALVVPSFESLKKLCARAKITYTTDAEMISHPLILERIEKEKDRLNESFAQFEKIKKIKLLPALWTIEAGELTPTLKCKRKVILKKYEEQITSIYEEKGAEN